MPDEVKIIRLKIDSSQAVDGGKEAQRALEAIEKQTRQTSDAVSRMESGFDVAALVAKIAGSFYVFKEFADKILGVFKGVRDASAAVADFAEQLGVSTDFVQGSTLAAASHTVSVDKMTVAYTKATQQIGQAAQGQKDAVEMFDRLGVKILDATGKLRPTEDILANSAAAILKIDDPAKRVTASIDLFGKSGAAMIPMLADIASGADAMATKAKAAGAVIDKDVIELMSRLKSHSEEAGQKWNALVANIGAPIATTAMEAVNRILGDILDNLAKLKRERLETAAGVTAGKSDIQNLNDRIAAQEGLLTVNPNNFSAKASLNGPNGLYAQRDTLLSNQQNSRTIVMQQEEDAARVNSGGFAANILGGTNTAGTSTPPAKGGAGEDQAKRYDKLISSLSAAAAAQDKMTAAARQGDIAFQEQQIKVEAAQKAVEIYGRALDDADPKLRKIEDLLRRTAEGKAAQAFAVGTTELQRQNELLEAQLRLMNEAPEIQARELAIIKSKQEAEKAGTAVTAEQIEQRRAAIETNERLKQQADQIKQVNELWMEPLKQGLRDIQSYGASLWESILDGGKITAESMTQYMSKMVKKIAAEFLSLATIRPVMNFVVQGLSSAGIVSPATAAQMGFPAGGSAMPSMGGGLGGGFSLPQMPGGSTSSGSSSGVFGNLGGWLGSPIIPNGEPLASGAFGPTAPGLGGLTYGGALAGLGSIGMGAYQLFSGGGSTGSTIGGIGSMIGGVVSMIPGGQVIGPIISLASSLFGGLLGGNSEPPIPAQPALGINAGAFRGNASGGFDPYTWGTSGGGMMQQAQGLASAVTGLFRSAGVKPIAGSVIGGDLHVGTDHVLNGRQWADRPYTQAGLVMPGGDTEWVTYNDSSRNAQQAADLLIASVFKANVLRGGVSGASDALKAGVRGYDPQTADDTQKVIDLAAAYDKLGKAANPVKDQLDKLSASFDQLSDFAQKAGLSMDPVNAELEKQTKRTAQDFLDSMLDPLQVQLRALNDERESALASAEYIRDNIEGVYVDMDRISTYYTNKEAQLRDQFYQGSVESLQTLINRLTYGDLGNASPDTSLIGTRASYSAMLAQARAGDASAVTNLSGAAEAYSTSARSYFASSPEYTAIVSQLRADLAEVVASVTGGASAPPGAPANLNDSTNVLLQSFAQLQDMFRQSQASNSQLTLQLAEVTAQLKRQNAA